MIPLLNESLKQVKTPVLIAPETENQAGLVYDATLKDMLDLHNVSIEDLRASQEEEDLLNVEKATEINLSSGALTAQQALPLHAAFIKFTKDMGRRSDSEVLNREAATRELLTTIENNPQAGVNLSMSSDYDEPIDINNKYLYAQQSQVKTLNDVSLAYTVGARVGGYFTAGVIGSALAKFAPIPALKLAGFVIGATGAGTAADTILLNGMTVYQSQKFYTDWFKRIMSADIDYNTFTQEYDKLNQHIMDNIPKPYWSEIYYALNEGPSPYSDAQGFGTMLTTKAIKARSLLNRKGVNDSLMEQADKLLINDVEEQAIYNLTKEQMVGTTHTTTDVDIVTAIESRRALVPYEEKSVTVISPVPVEPARLDYDPIAFMPGSEKVSHWGRRRINYIDDNAGRGYTLEEAQEAVEAYDKMYSGDKAIYSAASPVTFKRAVANEATTSTGEGNQMYGQGPYASLEDGSPASKGVYSPSLDAYNLQSGIYRAFETDSTIVNDLKDIFDIPKVMGESEKFIKEGVNIKGPTTDIYSDLLELKKIASEHNKSEYANVVTKVNEKIIDVLLNKYKNTPSNVINYWRGMDPDLKPSYWIDQRNHKKLYTDQNKQIQNKLKKYEQGMFKSMVESGMYIEADAGRPVTNYDDIRNKIFTELFEDDEVYVAHDDYFVENISHLSNQYPIYYRIAMQEVPNEYWNSLEGVDLKTWAISQEAEELKKAIKFSGQDLQRRLLVDAGIVGNVHSSTNVVFFKNTPSVYEDVFKQEYNQGGYRHQKILDSGAFVKYDNNIQAYVVEFSHVVPGGKGRKPIWLHTEKLETFDPVRNKGDK